jgi:hypothetical protein
MARRAEPVAAPVPKGGEGAEIGGDFFLAAGEVIQIAVESMG